jgi:PIN domain nuclease of toxin-antitoxin system
LHCWELPGTFHLDLADRLIVNTARVTGAVLTTRDPQILDYAARGHLTAIAA